MTEDEAVAAYLADLIAIRNTGAGTAETSYYPALNKLLTALGKLGDRDRPALSSPRGVEGDFPDVAIYDARSNVLVLPVEVKGFAADIHALATSSQARRYAQTFGGGRVLVTNLVEFALSEIDATGKLVERDSMRLIEMPDLAGIVASAPARLNGLLNAASTIRGTIGHPRQVARLLAYHGHRMMERIRATGQPESILAPIDTSFREGLGMDLSEDMLVPTTVQTVLYGLFAAWLEDDSPEDFDWLSAAYRLRLPVYGDLIYAILSPGFVRQCDLPPLLDDTAKMLSWVDRDQFTAAFDGGAIEYFYEPFLAAFDSHLRKELGVWYTPEEIADYQVAQTSRYLRDELKLAEGIANAEDLVVLDPACGTGTYLTAVLRAIRQHHLDRNEPEQIASQHAADAALTRLIGFEILPAAFVIAHINVSHLLFRWGVPLQDGQRLRIYLTNSLTGWTASPDRVELPINALMGEIEAARDVKNSEPVLVIIGNPPYHGYSAADTAEERDLVRVWSEDLRTEYGVRKHRLGDLYVRFWRIAVHKIGSLTGRGVVSFITNRRWLGGRSFPLMRESIVKEFDLVAVDDLHGEVNELATGNGSVFSTGTADGIKVGTAIVTAVRVTGAAATAVHRRDVMGTGSAKRSQLKAWSEDPLGGATEYELMAVSRATNWRFTSGVSDDAPALDEYFVEFTSGVQVTNREGTFVARTKSELDSMMADYYDFAGLADGDLVGKYPSMELSRGGYEMHRVRERLNHDGVIFEPARVIPFEYRPFTRRYLYWETTPGALHRHRPELFANWFGIDGQAAIVAAQTARRPGGARPLATRAVPCMESVDPNARVFTRLKDYGPGVIDGVDDDALEMPGMDIEFAKPHVGLRTSIRDEWIEAARASGVSGDDNEVGDVLFFALVAIMQSPAWLATQEGQLDDFPSVPLPADLDALLEANALGRRFVDLADTATPVDGVTVGTLDSQFAAIGAPTAAASAVMREGRRGFHGGGYDPSGCVLFWDRAVGGGWTNVPAEVWEYESGGFAVLSKMLAYRVGDQLSTSDRSEVMMICRRIAAIIALSAELDGAFHSAASAPLELVTA